MYRNAYQRGLLTILHSGGANPLNIWDVFTQDGYISRFLDQDIKSMVLEIGGTNVSTSYIQCPKGKVVLGITMPFLVMVVKNLKKYFSFEVTILDETSTRRRFRVSNFQSTTQILPLCTAMPIALTDGWNQIQFNLAEFTRRAYKKQYVEIQKVKINANIRLRRVYFAERLLPEEELPAEYKLFFPIVSKKFKDRKTSTDNAADKENIKPLTSQQSVKPAEAEPQQEKVPSETKVQKSASKASVRSLKKVGSQASRRSQIAAIPEEQPKPEQSLEKVPAAEPEAGEEKGETEDKPEQVIEAAPETIKPQGEVPAAESPETDIPVGAPPSQEALTAETPAAEEPASEVPAAETPAAEETATEEPAAEEPAAEATA